MHAPIKYVEKGVALAANGLWSVLQLAYRVNQNPSFTPKWSDQPLLKSYEKTKPTLGWPRETDSLCPMCSREARQEIVDGKKDVSILLTEKVGEIKATILERDGKILMVKDCPKHGHFEDVMSIDPAFYAAPRGDVPRPRHPRPQRREAAQPRQQHRAARPRRGPDGGPDQPLQHDVRPVLHGRQPGRASCTSWAGRRSRRSSTTRSPIKPKRQMSVQFSGGEPTLSPLLPRRGPLLQAGRLQQRAGGDQRHRVREEPRVLPARRPRPACATSTCSSTASATRPTRTATSATCSTSSCAPSRTCTRPAWTSSSSSRSSTA